VATVIQGDFEWDDAKAASNVLKHGVNFDEAMTALVDPNAAFFSDPHHHNRFAAIGMSAKARVLYVIHVERGTRDRIISARPATASEEGLYGP
jgi:uncharacterized DUF497 family protein